MCPVIEALRPRIVLLRRAVRQIGDSTMSMVEKMLKIHPREVTTDKYVIKLNMPADYPAIEAPATEEGGVRERFFKSVAELPSEVTVVHPFNVDAFPEVNAKTLYVSPTGDDSGDGTKECPMATVGAALERMKNKNGGKIVLADGSYTLTEPLRITEEHSGTENCPLIITAEAGATPRISTSYSIPASAFVPVTDEAVLTRIKDCAKGKVLVCDLASVGITEYGNPDRFGSIAMLVDSKPCSVSRYPKAGSEIIMGEVYAHGVDLGTHTPEGNWEIGLTDEECLSWQWNSGIQIYGSLTHEWDRHYGRTSGVNKEKKTLIGGSVFNSHGLRYDVSNSFYFANALEALTEPGEWCINFDEGKIYYYPALPMTDETDVRFAVKPCGEFVCKGASNVIIDRLDLGRCCGSAVIVRDCRQVLVQRCHITGVCPGGREGHEVFEISDGFRNGIIDTVVEYFSCSAGSVSGGDRKYLVPANNFIQNCKIINPLCRFGISAGGCGNVVSHNYVHNTTMGDCGHNEGIIEYNIVEGGDTEAHDTGMIYVGGGGCSSCGNHYRYNYFFDFEEGDYGIYFDDLSRGMYAYGNIVVGNGTLGDGTIWKSGGRSYNHHNGGEHCFWNNISIDAGFFAFGGDVSYWMTKKEHWHSFFDGIYGAAMNMMESQKYMDRNPTYKDYVKAVIQHKADRDVPGYEEKSGWAERRLRLPWCNHYENNLIFRAARPYKLDNGIETATGLETNYITNDDPGFVDLENRDYRIKPDAEVYKHIPDFIAPPFERMGPVEE